MSTQKRLNDIKSAIDWHCENNFNKDYHNKVNNLIKILTKNNNFSMGSGKEGGWVAGLLYVVGEDSDLFNQDNYSYNKEYYTKTDVALGCGVSVSTMKLRAQKIREALPVNSVFKADISDFNNTYEEDSFDGIIPDELKKLGEILANILQSQEFIFRKRPDGSDEKYKEYQAKAVSSSNHKDAVKYIKKAIAEAKKLFSSDLFKELKGELWIALDARPYMSLRKELADIYCIGGEYDKSIKEHWDLIELNRYDNQGSRYDLATLLLQRKRFEDFEKLMDMFEDDTSTFMIYSKALFAYQKDDILSAKRCIKEAFKCNEYVPQIFMGLEDFVQIEGFDYTFGGQDEATLYVISSVDSWEMFDGALFWLVDEYFNYKEKKREYIPFSKPIVKEYVQLEYF